MTHPIVSLQASLLSALGADVALTALVGAGGVFDAPPKARAAPYVVLARHDVIARDADLAPGHEHRLLLHVWAAAPSRKAALAIAARVLAAVLDSPLAPEGLAVTLRRHERTDTAIDPATGQARAALTVVFFTEPDR
jgi:hypothetical protein